MYGVFLITAAVFASGAVPASAQQAGAQREIPGAGYARVLDSCRAAVRAHAAGRFGTPKIEFREIHAESPGLERVSGTFLLRRGPEYEEPHEFACVLNPEKGRVRSVEIDRGSFGTAGATERARIALESCRRAVEERMSGRGSGKIRFGSTGFEGRRVVGTVWVEQGQAAEPFEFACRADPARGSILAVDVYRR
jgi:hypothetical protein